MCISSMMRHAFSGNHWSYIARLNSDGSYDTGFDSGLVFNNSVFSVALATMAVVIFMLAGNSPVINQPPQIELFF